MAQGGDMTLCSGASPEEAKRMRRVSGARTLALALGKGKPFFVREPSMVGHVDPWGQ